MKHIINLAFDVDDQRIVDLIETNAEKEVIQEIKNQVEKRFISRYYNDDPLYAMVKDECQKICVEHESEIIERAVKLVAEKIMRKKSMKEKIKELEGTINDKLLER